MVGFHADSTSSRRLVEKLPTAVDVGVAEMETVMSTIRSYPDLDAWQAAMELLLMIYDIASTLPQVERFELASQMRRAAVSVPSNVAEGQAYGPSARYLHHVRIALGSLAELDTQLEAILRIGYLPDQALIQALKKIERTGKLLHGLERSLKLQQVAGWTLAFAVFLRSPPRPCFRERANACPCSASTPVGLPGFSRPATLYCPGLTLIFRLTSTSALRQPNCLSLGTAAR